MRKVAAALTAILALVSLTGCTKYVPADDVAKTISQKYEENAGVKPDSVECKDKLKAEKGATVTCVIKVKGQEQDVKATVNKVEGNTAYYDIAPEGEPRQAS